MKKKTFIILVFTLIGICSIKTVAVPSVDNDIVVVGNTPDNALINLVPDGNAPLTIHIAGDSSKEIKIAVADLSRVLSEMFGVTFVVEEDGKEDSGIVVGTLKEFPNQSIDVVKSLAIKDTYDGKESYVIRTNKKRLLLLGATELGASHAVYRFLDELGCRWFFPTQEWEVIPKRATANVSITVDDRPAILSRRIWYQWGFYLGEFRKRSMQDYDNWCRRNRIGASLQVAAGHSWATIIRTYKKEFEDHPEYFAKQGEKDKVNPNGSKFCPSNPKVVELCIKYARDYFDKYPDRDMVSMDPSDGGGHCECDACLAKGKISNRVFSLVNAVADGISETHPGKMVGCLAYNFHSEVPDFPLRDNVLVQIATKFTRGKYSFNELMKLWPEKCKNMGYYDYFSVYQWNHDLLPGGRGADISYIRKTIPMFAENSAKSVSLESGNNWGLNGRGYYITSKLLWDPNTDVDSVQSDFYEKAFGPAASAMRRYYERVDPGNKPLMGESLMGAAFRDVQEATTLAKNFPDVLARLNQIKIYLEYNRLYLLHQSLSGLRRKSPEAMDKAREAQEAIFTHVYRTRFSYMNHWAAIRQIAIQRASQMYGGKPYIPIKKTGIATLNLQMAKDGLAVDRVILTTNSKYKPGDKKIPVSPKVSGVFQPSDENDLVVINAEDYDRTSSCLEKNGTTWVLTKEFLGFTGAGAMQLMPDVGKYYRVPGKGPQLDYKINFKNPGKYYVWIKGFGPHSQSTTIHAGLNDQFIHTSDLMYCNYREPGFKWTSFTSDGALAWAGNNAPWKDMKPYTQEEINANFAKGLSRFHPQDFRIDNCEYSDDLVPVVFPPSKNNPYKLRRKDVAGNFTKRGWGYFQGGSADLYALYSFNGEPVEFDLLLGIHPSYRDGAPASYWLSAKRDSKQKISKGILPVDEKKWHHLSLKVPKAGVYFLSVRDSSAGFVVAEAENGKTPITWVLKRGVRYYHADYMQPHYFYVPKGKKTIQFYWKGIQIPLLYNPEGEVALRGLEPGLVQNIPVPEGMDGKLWCFKGLRGIILWMFNVPSCLSEYPHNLLIPREVAEKDGLKIVKRREKIDKTQKDASL